MTEQEPETVSVDIVLFAVGQRGRDGRVEQRLVLRRSVWTEGGGAAVEEMWISARHGGHRSAASAVRELGTVAAALVLAEPVRPVPGMSAAEAVAVQEIGAAVAAARVEVVAVVRARSRGPATRRRPAEIEFSCAPGHLGHAAREMFTTTMTRLRLRPTEEKGDDGTGGELSPSGVGAVALSRDLGDARARIADEKRWDLVARAGHELAEHQPEPVEVGAPPWSRWDRRVVPDGPQPEPRGHVAVLIGVDGASVGTGNVQYRVFSYELQPSFDLDEILERGPVRSALQRFAESGGDPGARTEAVAALRASAKGERTDWGTAGREDPLPPTSEVEEIAWLGGTVLICDCRGIQVGNRLRQYNTYSEVLAPSVAAHDLFQENPGLVETIVDHACGFGGANLRPLQNRLATAVCGAADTGLARPADIRPYGSHAHDTSGVMIGDDNRQVDSTSIAVRLPAVAGEVFRKAAERAAKARDAAARRATGPPGPTTGPPGPTTRPPGPMTGPTRRSPPRRKGPSIGGP